MHESSDDVLVPPISRKQLSLDHALGLLREH